MESGEGGPKGKSEWYFQKSWRVGCWVSRNYRVSAGLKHQAMILNFPASIWHSFYPIPFLSPWAIHPCGLWQGGIAAPISVGLLIICQNPSEPWHLHFISCGMLVPPGIQPPSPCFHPFPSLTTTLMFFFCKRWAVSCLLILTWPEHAEFFLLFLPACPPGASCPILRVADFAQSLQDETEGPQNVYV